MGTASASSLSPCLWRRYDRQQISEQMDVINLWWIIRPSGQCGRLSVEAGTHAVWHVRYIIEMISHNIHTYPEYKSVPLPCDMPILRRSTRLRLELRVTSRRPIIIPTTTRMWNRPIYSVTFEFNNWYKFYAAATSSRLLEIVFEISICPKTINISKKVRRALIVHHPASQLLGNHTTTTKTTRGSTLLELSTRLLYSCHKI